MREAPSAERTASSRVRAVTENDSRAYTPITDSTSAIAPSAVSAALMPANTARSSLPTSGNGKVSRT